MSPKTVTAPLNDGRMWRRLVALTHPDRGGDHNLFIWTTALRESVCGGELESPLHPKPSYASPQPERLDFGAAFRQTESFADLTIQAVELADEVAPIYGWLLRLLEDCAEMSDGTMLRQQRQGATYRSLAAIAHKAGMSRSQRQGWYRVAESVPLSQRHAGHIIVHLTREESK